MRGSTGGAVIAAALLLIGCTSIPQLTEGVASDLGLGTPTDGPLPAANVGLIGLPERESAWTRDLPQLLPAMERCAAEITDDAVVVKGWPIGGDQAGVRFALRDGSRVDCVADASDGAVVRLDVVTGSEKLQGEGDLVLRLGAERPDVGWCKAADRVLDGGGRTVGWLSRDVCWNLL